MPASRSIFDTEQGISIYFVVFSSLLALVLVLSKLLHDRPRLSSFLPEAGMVLLVGIITGSIASLFASDEDNNQAGGEGDDDDSNQTVANSLLSFSPNVFFIALLPPIIFNSGYHIRRELFFRHITPILLFACLGTLISALSIAGILGFVDGMGLTGPFQPTFTELLTFGALISATDPVSTLAVFQAKRVDPQLFYLVFGESVMNDAVGLVLFNSFAKFVQRDNGFGKVTLGIFELIFDFIWDSVGSLCLGVISGIGAAFLLKNVDMRETRLLELCLYILIMYVPFLLAEVLRFSGIVTILFTGVAARRYAVPNLSPETEANADVFFRLAAHLAETSIFLDLGMSVFGVSGFGVLHWRFVLWSLFACLVGRALNVYPIAFFFNLTLSREGLDRLDFRSRLNDSDEGNIEMLQNLHESPPQEQDSTAIKASPSTVSDATATLPQHADLKIRSSTAHMLWFSGLRGAVAYACARKFPDTFGHSEEFIMTTMMIVLLTVFVLGGTTEVVLKALNIEMNVDEDKYMKTNYREGTPGGYLFDFETRYVFPCVIRDFGVGEPVDDDHGDEASSISSTAESPTSYRHQVEMTESEPVQSLRQWGIPIPRSHKKTSLYDYGSK